MADVTLPHTIQAGNQRSPAQLQANFEALRDGTNDHLPMTDADLASANNAVYETLLRCSSRAATDLAAATYYFTTVGGLAASGASTAIPITVDLDDADYTVAGLTAKLRLRAFVGTNATVPAITFTVGLYPVTFAGAADTLEPTLGTVVAGSTVAIASPPASTPTRGVGADFNVPADGVYAPGVVLSGTLTNNALPMVGVTLQTRNV